MASTKAELYEGMFLMSPAAGGDLPAALAFVREILDRAQAEVVTVQKWDDRKLAYAIRGQKRGTFILALFRVNGARIANIERDCNLSDQVTRVLVLRADHFGEMEIEAVLNAKDKAVTEAQLREGQEDQDADGVDDESQEETSDEADQEAQEVQA